MKKVLISGGWDLMHYNHVKTLRLAARYGDWIIVNVLSDERMRIKKGEGRPLLPLKERMSILTELRSVNEVISIPGPNYPLFEAIKAVKPNVVLINTDEQQDISKEQAFCDERGIELIKIPRIDDSISTTKLIERLRKL